MLFVTGFSLRWIYVPVMSKGKALELAVEKMAAESSELKFYSIRHDKHNNRWLIEYKEDKSSDQCTSLEIGRDNITVNFVTCFENKEN
ncbi:hypothetical protein [Paenibacillus sp. FSL H8-0537]|uniref:hypothetical protein n=1 Tax=Paenibacillus sp. FSL H8-0537 TaxID=2921399 RepID=UPI003100BDAB